MEVTEVVETQSAVISMQAGVINELFSLLMQHISVEEADALAVVESINEAARVRETIEI